MPYRTIFLIAVGATLAGCAAPPVAPISTPAAPAAAVAVRTAAAPPAKSVPLLLNAGFESTQPGLRGDPSGWFSYQHAGPLSYKYSGDAAERHGGERSLRIDNIGPEIYGAIAQGVDATAFRGQMVRLSAWVKTRDADDGGAVLMLLALQSGATQAQNFMNDAPIKGTTGWTRYTITLAVPPASDRLEVGMMMRGKGTAWIDDVELTIANP